MTDAANILIVEDERSIASFLRRGLVFEGYDVRVTDSGAEALSITRDTQVDLIVLDIMLPGDIDGVEVCRRIREAGDQVPILMLTARDEVADRVGGLDAGADDYMVKPFAFEELLARLRALLRRKETRDVREEDIPESFSYSDLVLDTTTRYAFRGERQIELTAREFDLLLLFLRHPQQVMTRELIMERIWGDDFPGESNVLEVTISNLRRRLEAEGESRLLQTVRGVGYALREQSS
ncbi:MAG: response regulator transcription factor [Thermomicrobiaceae bacterium]